MTANVFLSVIIFLASLCLTRAYVATVKPTEQQKNELERAFKELLDVRKIPEEGDGSRGTSKSDDAAVKYMQKLFEQYQHDSRFGHQRSNIVRSISPTIDRFGNERVMSFDLKNIKPGEQRIRGQLQYNVRHKHRSSRYKVSKLVHALVLCNTSSTVHCLPPGVVKLRPKLDDDDSLSFDVTDMINNALEAYQDRIYIKFTRRGRVMKSRDVMKRNAPFLLVFSDSDLSLDNQRMQSFMYPEDDDEQDRTGEVRRAKRSSGYYTYTKGGDVNEEARVQMQLEHARSMGPRMLQARRKSRKSRLHRQRMRAWREDPMMGFGQDVDEDNDSSFSRKRPRASPRNDDLAVVLLDGDDGGPVKEVCSRHNLKVEFKDVGWADWIIAPPSYDAFYCSGECSYPFSSNANATNHAILQTLARDTGRDPSVPAVCCSPDRMDSMSMLYYDEKKTVILKNFPSMIVSTCGCR